MHAQKPPQCTMLTSHFAIQMQLSLAPLSNNRAMLFALFYPLSLFCWTTPHPHTHRHTHTGTNTHLHHFHYMSFPSKSLSFLLLIMVVGPCELFKAVRAARKAPSAPKRDDLSAERESRREGKRARMIRLCWHEHSIRSPDVLVEPLFLLSQCPFRLRHTLIWANMEWVTQILERSTYTKSCMRISSYACKDVHFYLHWTTVSHIHLL